MTNLNRSSIPPALVGRQSIYDKDLNVFGFELLYRAAEQLNHAPEDIDGNHATSDVVMNTFLELGIEKITGGKTAFINITEEIITGDFELPLSKNLVVLEVLEHVKSSDEVIEGLKKLKSEGYTLALDDFIFEESKAPLIEYVDILKIDISQLSKEQLMQQVPKFAKEKSIKLLAEKVETNDEFEFCKSLGFAYFQGFFLSKPVVLKEKKLPANKLAVLQLLNKLQDPDVQMEKLEVLISNDPTLSYKLLRYINSPAYGLNSKISNIGQAVGLLGLNPLRQWMRLIALSEVSDKSTDLIHKSIQRAKMCELLAKCAKQNNYEDYFLCGLFSPLDAMLDLEMKDVVLSIHLPTAIGDALVKGEGLLGSVLKCVIAYEEGDWNEMHCGNISASKLQSIYMEALVVADETVYGLTM